MGCCIRQGPLRRGEDQDTRRIRCPYQDQLRYQDQRRNCHRYRYRCLQRCHPHHQQSALKAGKLVDALSAKGPFTVFAPANGAFAELPKAKLAHLLDPANLKELDALLEYHVVAGTAAFAQDLTDGEKIKTVEGDSVLIKLNDATGHATGATMINDATAIITDIEASNGVIHIINKVLDPSTAGFNIVEVAAAQPELSTLVTALKAGKLVDALSAKGPFTVFAPANGAFAELSKAKLAHLLDPANIKELDAVLEYHVVAGTAAFVKDLTDGERIKTLEGDDVLIKINSAIRINDATAIITDIAASNGVIHII